MSRGPVNVRSAGRRASSRFPWIALAALVLTGCRADTAPHAADFADAQSPPELVDMVAGMLPRVERLSGLDRTDVLRMRWQTRDGSRRYVEQRLDQEMPADQLDGVRRTYIAMGLLPDTLDLRALLLDLYTEQVLGYYDPSTTTLFVLREADLETVRPVVIHELVHALQDQHTNLDSLVSQERGNDRQTAAHAALEGHAMLVMFAALAEEATRRTIDPATLPNPADELGPALAAQNEQFPVFRRAPPIIRETLLFPYVHGSDFVYRLWQSRRGAERYPAPLGALLPQSTAQVLQPVELFIDTRRDPVDLRIVEPAAGWRTVREDTFGQLETAIYLAVHLGPTARVAATGWAGDRYVLLTRDSGDVLLWISVWASAPDAARFAAAMERIAGTRADRQIAVTRYELNGRPAVRIVDAPRGAGSVPEPVVRVLTAAP